MKHGMGCLFIPFEEAKKIHPSIKIATDEDIKKLIEISRKLKNNGDDNMGVFEAVAKTLSKPTTKAAAAAAAAGATVGSILGATAASPDINIESNTATTSTTTKNRYEALIGFVIILIVILCIGYAMYNAKKCLNR